MQPGPRPQHLPEVVRSKIQANPPEPTSPSPGATTDTSVRNVPAMCRQHQRAGGWCWRAWTWLQQTCWPAWSPCWSPGSCPASVRVPAGPATQASASLPPSPPCPVSAACCSGNEIKAALAKHQTCSKLVKGKVVSCELASVLVRVLAGGTAPTGCVGPCGRVGLRLHGLASCNSARQHPLPGRPASSTEAVLQRLSMRCRAAYGSPQCRGLCNGLACRDMGANSKRR